MLKITITISECVNVNVRMCKFDLCGKLKKIEDDWIMRLGSFYYPGGLNKRDKIKRKARGGY